MCSSLKFRLFVEKPEAEKPDENKKPDAETIKDGEYSINFKALKDLLTIFYF
jgi:hypothetical protein